MRICIVILAFTTLIADYSIAQNTNPWPATGNVGIGTTAPQAPLDLGYGNGVKALFYGSGGTTGYYWGAGVNLGQSPNEASIFIGGANGACCGPENFAVVSANQSTWPYSSYTTRFVVNSQTGNVGIGTITPQALLDVAGTGKMNVLDVNNGNADGGRVIFRSQGYGEWRARNFLGSLGFFPGEGNPTSLWLQSDGNVGIGTICAHAKLAVDGNILAKKVTVSQNGWCDYVFDKDYKLPSLTQLERYILQNHHLPEVPTTEEVKKDGIDLGDNQATLLKKIEELTLYVIEQNKKIEQQNQRQTDQQQLIEKQNEIIKTQQERLDVLEKRIKE